MKPVPPPPIQADISMWKGITIEGPNGRREFNILCKYSRVGPIVTRILFDDPINARNGETVTIGEPFAEEIDENQSRRRH